MLALLLCCLPAIALAQSRDKCCTPLQWEGYEEAIIGIAAGTQNDAILEYMHLHVDFPGQRIAASAMQESARTGDSRQFFVIDNFATNKRSFVQNGTCTITNITSAMAPNCIPLAPGHYGVYYIGAGAEKLEVDAWSLPSSEYGNERHFRSIRLGTTACVPYQYRHVFIPGEGVEHPAFSSFHSYNRITSGIADDSIFNTPEECKVVDHIELPIAVKDALEAFHQ